MFLLHGDSKYIDVLERSLYNNVISGVGLDGKTFFYPNPLTCDAKYKFNEGGSLTRQPWFNCSCCPTNLCRFLPSVPGYIYAQKQDNIYINLFVASATKVNLNAKTSIELSQQTKYPWDGNVKITIKPQKKSLFAVCLRIPGWVRNQPVPSNLYSYINPVKETISIKVNGQNADYKTENGYAIINREWKQGDVIEYSLPMNIHRVEANPNVEADVNKVALERGPIVYCLEGVDNANMFGNLIIPDNASVNASFDNNKLNGIEVITGEGIVFNPSTDGLSIQSKAQPFIAIPYYSWCNRGKNTMEVWLPRKIEQINLTEN
jgi:DUF1680 family protein